MYYVIKYSDGTYVDVRGGGFAKTLKDARFFNKIDIAQKFMLSSISKKNMEKKPEIRQCPTNKPTVNGRIAVYDSSVKDEQVGTIHTDVHFVNNEPMYGNAVLNGNKISCNVCTNSSIKEFEEYRSKLENRLQALIPLIQEYDKKQQDILHCVELMSLDAVKRVKLMNALIYLRHERRQVKEEYSQIESILSGISKVSLKEVRKYEYSFDLVPNILKG